MTVFDSPLKIPAALGLLLIASLLGACASAEHTRADIVDTIGAAPCEVDGQCRVLALGARPCGGAEDFIAWSLLQGDADQLGKLTDRYAQQRAEAHREAGRASTCEERVPPPVRCVRPDVSEPGQCMLQPEASASDARG